MREDLEAVLERLQTTKSIEELQVWAHEIRDALGVTHVVYHTVKQNGEHFGAFTYSLEWARRYVEKDYRSVDPVIVGSERRFHPRDWKTFDWSSPAARAFLREAMEAGVGNQGWTIPLWGPSGELATFSVNHRATDDEWDAITRVKAKDFLLIAHLVHQQAMRIINKEMAEATRDLSRREREALSMLSNGMARAEVADRLGISENTLRAYIDSARHKLGAANVTHAVALAIANGMIAANEPLPKY